MRLAYTLYASICYNISKQFQTYCNLKDTTSCCKSQQLTKAFREVWKQSKSSKAKNQRTSYSNVQYILGSDRYRLSCIQPRKSTKSVPLSAFQVTKSIPNAATIAVCQ